MMGLRLDNISLGYGTDKPLLRHFTAEVATGGLIALIGSNGVGKSTLLRTVAGLLRPLDGRIFWHDKELTGRPALCAPHICLVQTRRVAAPHLRVGETVALSRTPHLGFWGKMTQRDDAVVRESLEQLHIGHLAERTIGSLSDGEYQRTMLAGALARETPVILLDEPTAFLDYPSKMQIMADLAQLARTQNKIVLISTHDLPAALASATDFWQMTAEGNVRHDVRERWEKGGWQAVFG